MYSPNVIRGHRECSVRQVDHKWASLSESHIYQPIETVHMALFLYLCTVTIQICSFHKCLFIQICKFRKPHKGQS